METIIYIWISITVPAFPLFWVIAILYSLYLTIRLFKLKSIATNEEYQDIKLSRNVYLIWGVTILSFQTLFILFEWNVVTMIVGVIFGIINVYLLVYRIKKRMKLHNVGNSSR